MRTLATNIVVVLFILMTATPVIAEDRTVLGKASTYGEGYAGMLALPEGKGIRVKVCSPYSGRELCITRTSNDAGPSLAMQRAGRIVDLNSKDFEYLCQCSWRVLGVIPEVTVTYLGQGGTGISSDDGPTLTPPPTDTGGIDATAGPVSGRDNQSSAVDVRVRLSSRRWAIPS